MGRRTDKNNKSPTLPSSPSHSFSSSSSSDFEFAVSLSPRKSTSAICPADELFYKGKLLPLHLSSRLSMVQNLFLASSSTSSSSDTTTTASRDSTGSSDSHSSFSSDLVLVCDSSRPSSVSEEDEFKRLNHNHHNQSQQIKKPKYFSLARFSSVFRKEGKNRDQENAPSSSVKRMSSSAKDVIRKYLKKVKPLYEKLSQKQQQDQEKLGATVGFSRKTERFGKAREISISNARKDKNGVNSHFFSGNLRYPRKKNYVSSCPSSMRSSPSHSGVLCRRTVIGGSGVGGMCYSDSSSMEELQSAIQGAIAHCKNSMVQNKTLVSREI